MKQKWFIVDDDGIVYDECIGTYIDGLECAVEYSGLRVINNEELKELLSGAE